MTGMTGMRYDLRCQQHYFTSQTAAEVGFWVLGRAAWTRCWTICSIWAYNSGGIDCIVHPDETEDDGCTVDRISEADDNGVFGDCWLTRAADWGGDNGG